MPEHIDNMNEEERLKAENDFLKMKLMLERGADFGNISDKNLPPEIENEFLNHVEEWEKQFEEYKIITVFDRLNRPTYFKPVREISNEEIANAWAELSSYLHQHGISLDVCSPNVNERELYRFVVEELFQHEMNDIRIPGMMTNFIYDEFYPDPVYDNTRSAEDCIRFILKKEPLEFMFSFRSNNLFLNEHVSITEEQCKDLINQFKLAYEDIQLNDMKTEECVVNEKESWVKGFYSASATLQNETVSLAGKWKITFEKDEDYWIIIGLEIEGIKF